MSQPNEYNGKITQLELEQFIEACAKPRKPTPIIVSAATYEAFEKAIHDEVDAIWGIHFSEESLRFARENPATLDEYLKREALPKSPGIIVVGNNHHVPPGILAQVRMVETTCKPIETKVDVDNMISDVFRNIEREAIQRKKLEESFQKDMAVMKAKDYGVSTTIVKDKKPKYRNRKKPWRRTF